MSVNSSIQLRNSSAEAIIFCPLVPVQLVVNSTLGRRLITSFDSEPSVSRLLPGQLIHLWPKSDAAISLSGKESLGEEVGLRIWFRSRPEALSSLDTGYRPDSGCCNSFFVPLSRATLSNQTALSIYFDPLVVETLRLDKSLQDLRGAADAIETCRSESGSYLSSDGEVGLLSRYASELERFSHGGTLSIADGWDEPFYYWSDGDSYIVGSWGADSEPELNYEEVLLKTRSGLALGSRCSEEPTDDADADVLVVNGSACRVKSR